MINASFYNKKNTVNQLLGGKVTHYPIKNPSVTLEWYEYVIKVNETLYTIAEKILVGIWNTYGHILLTITHQDFLMIGMLVTL